MIVRALEQRASKAGSSTLANPDEWLISAFGGATVSSGVTVSADTALNSTAVFASVERLSRTVAALPFLVYRRLPGGGKERAPKHPNWRLLHDQGNEEMTALELRQFQMASLLLRGNSYTYKELNGAGQVIGLWPLRSDRVDVKREKGKLIYTWSPSTASPRTFFRDEIHHIRGLSTNGITGLSPISLARESIGLGLAAEEFAARFYDNSSEPRGLLRHPGKLDEPGLKRLQESWEAAHQPLSHKHKTAVLEEGMDWAKTGVDPRDSQLLESRKFQVRDAARIFGIQPHLIADLDNATFTNIESQGIEFVVYTLNYWLRSFEQTVARDLFTPQDRETHFAEFLVDALLRGDVATRGEFYMKLFQMGAISPNEIRGLENMNPYDGGNERYVQLNMVPVGQAGGGAVGTRTVPARPELRAEPPRQARQALRPAFARMFSEATLRIVRAERREVMRAARKHLLTRNLDSFNGWLDEYYREHESFVERQVAPVYFAYAEAVAPGVADEVGAGPADVAELEAFVASLAAAHGARHATSSRGQLAKVIEENLDAPIEAIDQRFLDWEEKRPGQVGERSAVQAGEAIAKWVMVGAGFGLVWQLGAGDNCEFCQAMSGRRISGGGSFAKDGETLTAEGRPPLTVSSNISQPPLHGGCNCSLTAG